MGAGFEKDASKIERLIQNDNAEWIMHFFLIIINGFCRIGGITITLRYSMSYDFFYIEHNFNSFIILMN